MIVGRWVKNRSSISVGGVLEVKAVQKAWARERRWVVRADGGDDIGQVEWREEREVRGRKRR